MKLIKEESVFKLLNNQWISAIRSGLLKLQGLIFMTCMISVLIKLISFYDNGLMQGILGVNWKTSAENINDLMIILINILPAMTISYSLVELKNNKKKLNKQNSLFISIVAFLNVILNVFLFKYGSGYEYMILGAFFSITIAIITTELYIFFDNMIHNKFKGLTYNYEKEFRE